MDYRVAILLQVQREELGQGRESEYDQMEVRGDFSKISYIWHQNDVVLNLFLKIYIYVTESVGSVYTGQFN